MLALSFQVILFAHLVWLGFYLVNRSSTDRMLGQAGLTALLLAGALGAETISQRHPNGFIPEEVSTGWTVLAVVSLVFAGLDSTPYGLNQARSPAHKLILAFAAFGIGGAALLIFTASGIGIGWSVLGPLAVSAILAGLLLLSRRVHEEGEALLPDLARSYDYSLLIAVVFGGQIVIAMASGPGASETMLWLLHGILVASIATQVFLSRLQGLLDRIAFANVPWLRQERAELRQVENLLPRVNMTDPLTMDEDEFARLTRRALGHYSDLTKLATSPLTNLPEVHRRLARRGVEPTTLERARELKLILAEAIERLRPYTDEEYGTTDEWRFFNALYYPYVIGMRPYSRRTVHTFDDPAHDEILDWFRTYVPERTLYNWQNAAAALVAENLREQEVVATMPGEPAPALIG